jgi:hypothetical protein
MLGLTKSDSVALAGPTVSALGILVVGVNRLVGGDPLALLGHAILLFGFAPIGWSLLKNSP